MDESAYRQSAPPPPRVFALELSAGAFIVMAGAVASLLLAIVVLVVFRGGLITLFLVGGPGFFYFLAGAPRSIEVHHERVVVRLWLRRKKTLAASELIVQQMPDELILIDGRTTYAIPADAFPGATFTECAEALSPIVARFDVRKALR